MWLFVGLGNPGPRYADTRHNVGFMVVDELASNRRLAWQKQFGGLVAKDRDCCLLKPLEFMNLSGFATQRALQFFKLTPADMVVVHDELDFPFGKLRLKSGGGAGGHNGLRSIIKQTGSRDFGRLRFGIDKPEDKEHITPYVLGRFGKDELPSMPELIGRSSDCLDSICQSGLDVAMNSFNKRRS